ncbi:MyTH4 domain-containing protein [Lactarius sanguifluus]|nr:MyTH4 domain-containing protein [Lactarius sanguifluus]
MTGIYSIAADKIYPAYPASIQLWEIGDESRGSIPYNRTKSGETSFSLPYKLQPNRPNRTPRLVVVSKSFSSTTDQTPAPHAAGQQPRPVVRHPRSYKKDVHGPVQAPGRLQSSASGPIAPMKKSLNAPPMRRNLTTDPHFSTPSRLAPVLPPIPGSEGSTSPTPTHSYRSFIPPRSPPRSLGVAIERLTRTPPQSPDTPSNVSKVPSESGYVSAPESTRVKPKLKIEAPVKNGHPTAPVRAVPSTPTKGPTVAGREIGRPVLNMNATLQHSPVRARAARTPIFVDAPPLPAPARTVKTLCTGAHPILPQDLASDIQQFVESEFAQRYFATHRTGFIFKRKVPVGQMMIWQRSPLTTPLLNLSRPLHKDAIAKKGATTGSNTPRLEEARWLLGEGLANGELRDEIYCQVMKQLTNNPNASGCFVGTAAFRGWQLLCVLLVTFPPSKNFEPYLHAFLSQHTGMTQGRVDVLAKHCIKRLAAIAKKGPRGKPPVTCRNRDGVAGHHRTQRSTHQHSASHSMPCSVYRSAHTRRRGCQSYSRSSPTGVLALGGTKSEGIFRIPGDSDAVAALKMRLDRGSYTLEGVDDPHVPASLFKLWLRELVDPLVPSGDVQLIASRSQATPRRVLFLDERVLAATKMTSANLALVMAPNLLRCGSDSMAIVFNNAQYEQAFVHNLLLHLNCGEIDAQYVPQHGLGAVPSAAPRASKSRNRRAHP